MVVNLDVNSKRAKWRQSIRWYRATALLGVVGLVVGNVVVFLAGDSSPVPAGVVPDSFGMHGNHASHSWPARLVLLRTSGKVAAWQTTLRKSYSTRWRGRGAMIDGVVWVGSSGLIWSPSRRWSGVGARGLSLDCDRMAMIDVTEVSRRSIGLAARQLDGSETWLLLRSADGIELVDRLVASGSQ